MLSLKELSKDLGEMNITEIKEQSIKDIAIIGIGLKLPKADSVNQFWENLKDGKDLISDLPENRRKMAEAYLDFMGKDTDTLKFKRGSYIETIDEFDYGFFNISPKEATLIDPNQKLFLEIASKAIEDSGYGNGALKGSKTGVYFGFVSDLGYQRLIQDIEPASAGSAIPGNMASVIPGRVSYVYDLKGPSVLVDTACSSSLVAIHTACRAMRNGDCEMAIAGSGKLSLMPLEDNNMLGIESDDYMCRAFDDSSTGTCMGEGIMAIVLKPLSKAIKDKDNIYAVIKGSAVNQDGSSIGITAPNALAQAEVLIDAWKDAGVDPATISYIEAHGTGTRLGDPIEIDGIKRAFSIYTDKKKFCAIGSVKTNLGHLDSAAGMVGLIKTVLALKNKKLPPSLHFKTPNRNIDFENSPVYVNDKLNDWQGEQPKRAGVSAFGLSGTNCHIVLEEAPCVKPDNIDSDADKILCLSAKGPDELLSLLEEYLTFMESDLNLCTDDMCYTAYTGRGHYEFRLAVIGKKVADFIEKLKFIKSFGLKTYIDDGIYYGEINNLCNQKTHSSGEINEICKAYVNGEIIDFSLLYTSRPRKMSIPTYSFSKKKCFINIPVGIKKKNTGCVNREAIGDKTSKEVDAELTQAFDVLLMGRPENDYSEEEIKIANVWGKELGYNEIDVTMSFYDMGGDSIIAINIANQINKYIGCKIKVTDIMNYDTVETLTKYISESNNKERDNNIHKNLDNKGLVNIPSAPLNEFYPMSSSQKRIYILEKLQGSSTSYNIPLALIIEGIIDREKFETYFKMLVNRHEAFRTAFLTVNDELVQKIHNNIDFEMGFMDGDEENTDNIIKSFINPFQLEKAPLFRVSLVKFSDRRHLLMLDMNHIIGDGVSLGIMIKEFLSLLNGENLSPLKIHYKDYVVWQNSLTQNEKCHEDFWRNILGKDLPLLNMPLDIARQNERSFAGSKIKFSVSKDKMEKVNMLSRNIGITLNTFVFAVYSLLLYKYSGQNELVLGTTVSGREHADVSNIIGVFINFLPICINFDEEKSFEDFVRDVKEALYLAYEHQSYPFEKMVELLSLKPDISRNPIFDTMLIFHNENEYVAVDGIEVGELKFKSYDFQYNTSKLDFKIDAYPVPNGELSCVLEYNTSLFCESSMSKFAQDFDRLIDIVVSDFDIHLKAIELFDESEKNDLERKRQLNFKAAPLDVVVCASFTAEPIEDYLKWWCSKFGVETKIKFAPYNQVFQQLLDPASLLYTNKGVNVLLVRFEDWIRNLNGSDDIKIACLEENYQNLIEIMRNCTDKMSCYIGLFSVSTHLDLSTKVIDYIKNLNIRWKTQVQEYENVTIIDYSNLDKEYDIFDVFDLNKDKIGHLPFTDEYFAAMGTYTARKILSKHRRPFKVVVLDCDNTLWKGICGEAGENGVKIHQEYIELQKFMVDKYEKGMLLAICSKNNEQDVLDVFSNNPDMVLKKQHFVSTRINWESKAKNIKSLSEELNLGLDSFIFIDDSPFECESVMKECPSVLTILLPEDTTQIPAFLNHIWAFDIEEITAEDRDRSKMYMTEKSRQALKNVDLSVEDFIKKLEIKVSINPMEEDQLKRVSQLTQRTNQFNLSTIRRSEEEITALLLDPKIKCFAVEVWDKFGDYGLVGVVITKEGEKDLFIDTFLLSCRVLGRGIENVILDFMGNYCREMGIENVVAMFNPTQKNAPFLEFLEKSGWKKCDNSNPHIYALEVNSIPKPNDNISCFYERRPEVTNNINKKDTVYTLDHIAIAVRDIGKAKKYYEAQGFYCGENVYDPIQDASLMICTRDGCDNIELVAPYDQYSPVNRMLEDCDSNLYHLCYRVKNAETFLSELSLKNINYEIIKEAEEAVLFNNQKVTFINVSNFGLVELLEMGDDYFEMTNNDEKLSVAQIVVKNISKAMEFLNHMGYTQKESYITSGHESEIYKKIDAKEYDLSNGNFEYEKNAAGKTRVIKLCMKGSGKIELIVPQDNSSNEHLFYEKKGAHLYNLYLEAGKVKNEAYESIWDVDTSNTDLLHNNYLLALHNHSAKKLMSIPVYMVDEEKVIRTNYEAPINEIEERLAKLWQQVLGIDKVGVNDSFFALGGHSLKATTLISRINKEFDVDILLSDIFKMPTIRLFSRCLQDAMKSNYYKIEPTAKREYYPVSSSQKRIFLLNQINPQDTAYNMAFALSISGKVDKVQFEEAFKKIINRHDVLRTEFYFVDGKPVQKILDNVEFSIEEIEPKKEENIDVLLSSLIKPFDLKKAPIFRVCLVKVDDEKYILFFDIHHIIADGVSYKILLNEFIDNYMSKDLANLRIQYKDYALWHNELIEKHMGEQEKYWLDTFKEKVMPLNMPLDYRRPHKRTCQGENIELVIEKRLADKVKEVALNHKTTPNAVLLSCYSLLLSKYTAQNDIVISSLTAGRNHMDLENLIGVFINYIPIKFSVAKDSTFNEYLSFASDVVMKAYDNQDYPFDKLLEKLSYQLDSSRNPLFDTAFILHNQFDKNEKIQIEDLVFCEYKIDQKGALLDFKVDAYFNDDEEICFTLQYNTDLFRKVTMQSFLKHFEMLLDKVLFKPDLKLGDISLFTNLEERFFEERRKLNFISGNQENIAFLDNISGSAEVIKTDTNKDNIVKYDAPVTDTQKKLSRICQEILRIKNIGINDNFFDVGGDSLKATSLVSRVFKEFNKGLTLTDIFDMPTIEALANYIEGLDMTYYKKIDKAVEVSYYPLSKAQKRMYLLNQIDSSSTVYNQPVTLEIEGELDLNLLETVFNELIRRHESLRTSFEIVDDMPMQRIHKDFDFKINFIENLEDDIQTIIRKLILPFDLKNDALLRVNVLRVSENKHILICDMPHIISDGISINILVKEFITMYKGYSLPELKLQYKDYCLWQVQHQKSSTLKQQEKYWIEAFKGKIPVLELKYDYKRPPIKSFEGDNFSFEVPKEILDSIKTIAKDSGSTLFMVLLSVFGVLLSKYSGQEEIIIGTPSGGRTHPDLQNVIGMFVNTLAIRSYPKDSIFFNEYLEEVKETTLKAFENQDYQFEDIVEKLDIPKDFGRNPLFDVAFVLQNNYTNEEEINDLKFIPYKLKNNISKFDLTLQAEEHEQKLNLNFEFTTDLFKLETISMMAKDYLLLLKTVSDGKKIKINEMEVTNGYKKREKVIKEEIEFVF